LKLFNAHTHQLKNNETAVFQLDIAAEFPIDSFFSAGIHPEKALSWHDNLKAQLLDFASHKQCLAIGEIGLDSRFDLTNQQEIYAEQLKIAATLKKPVILHCVNTWYKCMSLHKQIAPDTFLIYHGFSKPTLVTEVLKYEKSIISIGAAILTNSMLRNCIDLIPIDRLLLETDNSECDINTIYHEIAQLKSLPLSTFEKEITKNAKRIFNYE
jgi:TatD DNase family protein